MSGWLGSPSMTSVPSPIPPLATVGAASAPVTLPLSVPPQLLPSAPGPPPIPLFQALQQPSGPPPSSVLLNAAAISSNEGTLHGQAPMSLVPALSESTEPTIILLEKEGAGQLGTTDMVVKATASSRGSPGGSGKHGGGCPPVTNDGPVSSSTSLADGSPCGDPLDSCRKSLPSHIVFGGAWYERVQAPVGVTEARKTCNKKRICVSSGNRVEHLSLQLKVACAVLRLESRVHPRRTLYDTVSQHGVVMCRSDPPPMCDTFCLKNIWTVAYAGTVKDLHALIESDSSVINARGFVVYNRRQYGVKRVSDKFVLGFGQKATPLQYAAVAGHVDSVVLLLAVGAEDESYPFLKDILGSDLEATVKTWMEVLYEKCLSQKEWNCANVRDVVDCARSGKAHFISTGGYRSFVAKESLQRDVKGLPTAARTLLLSSDTTEIIARGVNKFFDIEDVEQCFPLGEDDMILKGVWLQRKLAGFVVTLFSLDGESIILSSKHVVEGPHVNIARSVLETMLSTDKRRRLASDLFQLGAAVSCECISSKDDFHHPVPERPVFDHKLIIFSIHKRNDLREMSVPPEIMQEMASEWGMPSVPCWRAKTREELRTWLAAREGWEGRDPDGEALTEGYVVVIEDTLNRLCPSNELVAPFTALLLRLKAKTVRYRTLRSLRSIVLGESSAPPLLFHEVLALWVQQFSSHASLRYAVLNYGVHNVYTEFEAYISERGSKRYRGNNLSVRQAYEELLKFTEKEAQSIRYAPLDVIFLCGLPGVGKSTLSQTIVEMVANGRSTFRYAIHLNRDEVAKDVANQYGIDSTSSKHKQRRLRSLVHQHLQRTFKRLVLFSLVLEGPGLLIFDACNARVDARRRWRQQLPKELKSFRLLHLVCVERAVLVTRIAGRRNHATLRGVEEAQAALYVVGKMFAAPEESESCICVDTTTLPPEELARSTLSLYGDDGGFASSEHSGHAVYSHRQAEEQLTGLCAILVSSIIGVRSDGKAALAQALEACREKTVTTVVVQLVMDFREMYRVVSSVVRNVVGKVSSQKLNWWERCKGALGFGNACPTGTVVKGHSHWLCGWLFDGRAVEEERGEDEWVKAFEGRYECRARQPHVTLFCGPAWSTAEVVAPPEGSDVDVILSSILLDPFALCMGAEVVVNGLHHEVQLGPGCVTPLHVTMGHTHRVKASYTGEMFSSFEQREEHNRELRRTRLDSSVKKSRLKFFNFLQVRLSEPVTVRGFIAVV